MTMLRREKRSASTPQNGVSGKAAPVVVATSRPVQTATSAGPSPSSRKNNGVNALTWPSATNWAIEQPKNSAFAPRQDSRSGSVELGPHDPGRGGHCLELAEGSLAR